MEWITTTMILDELNASNDGAAWDMFNCHFNPMLVNFGRRLGLSDEDAQDAAQKTVMEFVKAFRKGKYCRKQGRLSSWLFGIARNVMLNFRKHLPREHLVKDETKGISFWDLIEDESAVKHTWNTEWRRMVFEYCHEKVRREFDSKVFEAFKLYALLDVSAAEVGERLGMSRNAVFIAKSRVLSKMRQLGNEFEGDNQEE